MRLIDDKALKAKGIPYHRVHLDRLADQGKFPKPVKLGEGRGGARRWIEEEVNTWIAERAAARFSEPSIHTSQTGCALRGLRRRCEQSTP